MKLTAEIPEERTCYNCAFEDGCKGAFDFEGCEEHRFDWEVNDEPTEKEKQLMYADKLYQQLKEDDL